MASISAKASGSRDYTYSRKQKSLGLLCSNFLSLYDRDGVETIGLDDAASRLGVERRRIYDIVNVLENVGVLARRGKNRYEWKGFRAVPKTLQQLKEQGLKENCDSADSKIVKVSDDDEDEQISNPNPLSQKENFSQNSLNKSAASSKVENRREKSLGLLTQNFVKLFLCTNADMISLDEAAKILLGDARDPSSTITKVRRLYDIANVLSSMNFIEKTHHPETRKPSFRWLGREGQLRSNSANALVANDIKKRSFGTDLTNTCFKRSKSVSTDDTDLILKPQLHSLVKCENYGHKVGGGILEHCSGQESKNYQFGPFAPVNVHKPVKQVHDWENLASTYLPQYHNQALNDLFAHYTEAWKSWYSEVAGKDPIQATS